MRASGVFTGTTNSPSRLPRQSLYHSTIRAGRNLPDKEFRSMLLLPHAILCMKRDEHFCHPLHVAMQSGLYLLRLSPETGV
jgi:hypothetical protein